MYPKGYIPQISLITTVTFTNRGFVASSVMFLLMAISALSARPVIADPIASPFLVIALIAPINIPINGVILMVMYALFVLLEGSPSPMGTCRFVELVLESVLIMSLSGAMIDVFIAFSGSEIVVFAAGVSCILGIAYWLASRVLRMTSGWAFTTGAVFLVVNLTFWAFFWVADSFLMLPTILAISVLLFIVLLGRTAVRYHMIEGPIAWDEEEVADAGTIPAGGWVTGAYINDLEDRTSEMRTYVGALAVLVFVLSILGL